ncbi:armadillo-type protein [Calycina marina]|uniref:Armadillo-type protein n=1 Tax=Calycina marina TaxID=1763456 RepID=A0A9P8CG66_9HELO|nr:armadillo-type protein [Calycina marina]
MPSAVDTESLGNKRKDAPGKEAHVKGPKKVKIEKPLKEKKERKSKPVKKAKESSDEEDSDVADSDGGVPIVEASEDVEMDGNEEGEEEVPSAQDGLHPERAKAVNQNSQSAKEAHAKQKKLANERKAAKPLADPLARTKKLWERLRRKSHVPSEERKKLVAELFEIVSGNIKDYVLKHDSVRVVQTALKYANPEQKKMIARELQGTYRQLAESRYAKFLIGKLLVQGDEEIRDIIVPEFFGHVRRLIKHPEASWILDDVYRGVATKQQKAILLREWYGAEFALFQRESKEAVTSDLSEIIAVDSGKRAPIMRYLQELINHLIQKKLTGFTMLHDAMLQYLLNAKTGTEEVTDFIEIIKGDEDGDLMKNLAFTKSGARVVSLCLAYGTAKDRKQILKNYKDLMQTMAADSNAHIIILTAYEVIDDTVLTSKSIFPELLSKDADKQVENIVLAANDINARTTLLYLFQGRSRALFPPSLSSDLEVLAEIDLVRTSTSKKDPEIRRSELAKQLSPFLLKAIATNAADLVATSFGCLLITEVLFGAEGDKSAALAAVAEAAAGEPTSINIQTPEESGEGAMEGVEGPVPHVGSTAYGGRMLKSLIAGGRFDSATKQIVPVSPPLDFANTLYPRIKDSVIEWATGSSSFVILALLEGNFDKKDEVLATLKKNKKSLQKATTEETVEQKARREMLEVEAVAGGEKPVKKSKKKPVKVKEVGNAGSRLLLGLL